MLQKIMRPKFIDVNCYLIDGRTAKAFHGGGQRIGIHKSETQTAAEWIYKSFTRVGDPKETRGREGQDDGKGHTGADGVQIQGVHPISCCVGAAKRHNRERVSHAACGL